MYSDGLMAQRRQPRTAILILLTLLLVLPTIGGVGEGPVTLPVDTYYLGEPVAFSIAPAMAGNVTIRVTDGVHLYRFRSGEPVFTPIQAGEHNVTVRNEAGETLQQFSFMVLPVPIWLEKDVYTVGEPVAIRLNLTPGHDYALSIAVGGVEFQFAGGAQESVSFTPTQPGSHTIQLDDLIAVESYRRSFDVEQAPAVGPAQQGLFSPDEIRAALQRRFPSLEVGEVRYDAGRHTHDVTVRRLKDSVALRGVKDVANISAFDFVENRSLLRGLATDVVAVEGAVVDNATVRLAKYGPVAAIGRCDDFDAATGSCSAWVRTDIPFQDYGDYIEFTVPHFTGYGGISQTDKYYVTSVTTPTQLPNMSSAQDGTAGSYGSVLVSSTLYNFINASTPSTVTSRVIRTTDVVNFSTYWTDGSRIDFAYATFKLYYGASAPTTLICQRGDDSTGGVQIPDSASALVYGNCSPSSTVTVPNGTKLWFVVNVYASSIGSGGTAATRTATLYWDTTTYDTWVNISSYQSPDINVTTNAATYSPGALVNASGTFYWTNGSGIGSKNVTVTFLNTTGGVMQSWNVTTNANGNYWSNYTLPANADVGTWKANVTGYYNATINATNQTTFQVLVLGTLNVSLSAPPDNTSVNQNATFYLNATITCTGITGAVCGNIIATARYNASSTTADTNISNMTGATPLWTVSSFSVAQLWNVSTDPTVNNETANDVAVDAQGNIIVTGYCTGCGVGGKDAFYTVKYNGSGSQLWNVSTNPAANATYAYGVAADNQSNVIVTGYCNGCGSKGAQAFYTVKYNSSGSQLWNATTDPSTSNDVAQDIAVDPQGNIIVAGYCSGCAVGTAFYMVKYNSSGSQLWNATTFVTSNNSVAYGVAVDNQSNIVLTGTTTILISTIFTVKYNSTGSQLWNVSTDPNSNSADESNGVAVDSQGNVIVAGACYGCGSKGQYALFTVKYNSSGSLMWNVSTDPSTGYDKGYDVVADNQGDIIVTGYCTGCGVGGKDAFYTVKYNGSGSQLWNVSTNPAANATYAYGVAADNQSNIIVAGDCTACGANGGAAFYTVKYSQPALNPLSYANLSQGQSWNALWLVNLTGTACYEVDTLFNSSYASITSNDTADATVCADVAPVISSARINASSPANYNSTVRVNASVTDQGFNLQSVTLQIAPPTGTAYNTTPSQSGSEYYNASIQLNQTGTWVFTFFANDSTGRNATPTAAQDGLGNAYVNVLAYGTLNVSLSAPPDNTGVNPNATFYLNATITCNGITGAVCGNITATARYNMSSASPDTAISTTTSATPFYIAGGVAGLKSYDFNGITNPASPVNATYYTADLSGIPPSCTDGYCEGTEFVNNTGSTDTAYQDVYANDTNYTYTYSTTSAAVPCIASENYHFRIAETNTPNLTLEWSGSHFTNCSSSTSNNFTILMWNFTLGDWDRLYYLNNTNETDVLMLLNITKASPYIGNSSDVHVFVRLMRNGCASPATCKLSSNYINLTAQGSGASNPQTNASSLSQGQSWNASWLVNLTGSACYEVDTLFNSSYTSITSNDSADSTVCAAFPPVISSARINASSPANYNSTVRVNASVTDQNGDLANVTLQIAPPTGAVFNTTPSQSGSEYYNASIQLNQTGTWVFTFFANDSTGRNATPTAAQDGLANNYIEAMLPMLNVTLQSPSDPTNVLINTTVWLNATVKCVGGCGYVNASALFNASGATPDTPISFRDTATPVRQRYGELYWANNSSSVRPNAVAVDGNGNVITAGGWWNYYTVKFNGSTGALLWSNITGSMYMANDVAVDANNDVIVTGSNGTSNAAAYYTVKYNGSTGAALWTNITKPTAGIDTAYGVAVDANNDVIVTGSNGTSGDTVYYTVKYNGSTGAALWTNITNPSTGTDIAYDVAVDGNNDVIVAGRNGSYFFTVKYNGTNGALLWANTTTTGSTVYGVAVDGNNDVIVTGNSNSGYYTVKYNGSTGALLWANTTTAARYAYGVAVDGNNDVIVTGSDFSSTYYYTVKYNGSTGAYLWSNITDPTTGMDYAEGVAVDSDGNIIVAGRTGSGDYIFKMGGGANPLQYDTLLRNQQSILDNGESWTVTYPLQITNATCIKVNVRFTSSTATQNITSSSTICGRGMPTIAAARINDSSPVRNATAIRLNASVTDPDNNIDKVWILVTTPTTTYNISTSQNGNERYNDTFVVNETGYWNFTFYANDTDGYNATPLVVTDSNNITQIRVANMGTLNVTILAPPDATTIPQNSTFWLNATVVCTGLDGATCGNIDLTARYNGSSATPNTAIPIITATPLYITNDTEKNWYSVSWNKTDTSGWSTYGVVADRNGDVITTGSYSTSYYTAKYNGSTGALLWGVTNSTGWVSRGVAVDGNGDVLVTGYTGSYDWYTMKYNGTNGVVLWTNTTTPGYSAYGVAVDGNNDVIVTGTNGSTGDTAYYTMKYNGSTGAVLWTNITNPTTGIDTAYGVAVDKNGDVIVTGNNGNYKWYTVKYNGTNGAFVWANITTAGFYAYGVAVDGNNNVIVTGSNSSNNGGYTVKYNGTNGAFVWANTTTAARYAYGVAVDGNNDVIVTGTNGSTGDTAYYTVKHNGSTGAALWTNITNPTSQPDTAYGVAIDNRNNVIVSGSASSGRYTIKYAYTTNPIYHNELFKGDSYTAGWLVNLTGTACYEVDVNITSDFVEVQSNDTADRTVCTLTYGTLNVSLSAPPDNTGVDPNTTFYVNATITCTGAASAVCGNVSATARYNESSSSTDTAISTTSGTIPFWTATNPQTNTSSLTQGQSWNVSWLVNATGANGTSYYVDALFNSSYAEVTSNDTLDARVCLGTCQVAGPPNVTIDSVSSISPVTPLAGLNVSILVNFTASHAGGVGNLNDSTALANFSKGSVSRSGGCSPNDQNSTTTIYNCTVQLTYYDVAGAWSVNVSVSDVNGSQASNGTTSFTYNTLVDINLSITDYGFGTLAAGSGWTAGQSNPVLVDNRGNVNLTLNLTAYALANGSRLIGAGNMTVNVSNAVGTPLVNNTLVIITNSTLVPDTDAGETNRSLYLYISVPSATPAGNFTSQSNWVVQAYG